VRELVGQGKPFYSGLDKAAGLLRRKVGTGSEFLKELMSIPGVKQAEIAERGLGELLNAPKMTHEQFMAALGAKPAPAIHEKVLGEKPKPPSKEILRRNANDLIRVRAREYASEGTDSSAEYRTMAAEEMQRLRRNHMDQALRLAEERATENPSSTYHEQYTLPGGDNYREMLIKMPRKSWAQRPKEERVIFDDEHEASRYAGDSGQAGFLEGQPEVFPGVPAHFNREPNILASLRLKDRTGPNGEKLLHLEELQSDWHQQGREKGYNQKIDKLPEGYTVKKSERHNSYNVTDPGGDLFASGMSPETAMANAIDNLRRSGVPDAPFKKNWEEMALKRLIHHAAENGYHGIVITPGAEQADRYSLAKHISGVDYIRNELKPQRNEMIAYDPRGNVIFNEFGVTPEKLEQHIGKEAAQKLLSQEAQPNDNGLPTHSLRGEQLVVGGEGMKAFYDKKVPNILNGIGKKYGVKTELGGISLQTKPEKIKTTSEGRTTLPAETANLHHFPITEEMRQDVKQNGIPLYKSGGSVPTQ
jgi:hypothetical protein